MKKKMGKPSKKIWVYKKDLSWKIELDEFYKDIKFDRNSSPGLNEALKNLNIINKIYKSN